MNQPCLIFTSTGSCLFSVLLNVELMPEGFMDTPLIYRAMWLLVNSMGCSGISASYQHTYVNWLVSFRQQLSSLICSPQLNQQQIKRHRESRLVWQQLLTRPALHVRVSWSILMVQIWWKWFPHVLISHMGPIPDF